MSRPSIFEQFATSEELQRQYFEARRKYGERHSDIYVSTFSRSGTTWMQLILYQLTTTDGNMDFHHLFDISPWIFYSTIRGIPPVQVPDPRILKTHEPYDFFPKSTKGKFIYVIRDGRDVIVSLYYHKINVRGYDGSFDEHVNDFINNDYYNWFEHVRAWLENTENSPILYIQYEHLKRNFREAVEKIASFCNIDLSEKRMSRIEERTSFAFMKAHQKQLGPHPTHFAGVSNPAYVVRDPSQFVRNGQIGDGMLLLEPHHIAMYENKFDAVLGSLISDFPMLDAYRSKCSRLGVA